MFLRQLIIARRRDGVDNHCFCFDANRQAMIDNCRWAKVLKPDDSDLASGASAQSVFEDWFPGASEVHVRGAYVLLPWP